jgi:exopolysaccharide biosynthesis protein
MSEEVNWNIMGDNREIRVFTIPVGNLDRKESEKLIQEIMNKYKENSIIFKFSLIKKIRKEKLEKINKLVN